jgi:hypothetical protein
MPDTLQKPDEQTDSDTRCDEHTERSHHTTDIRHDGPSGEDASRTPCNTQSSNDRGTESRTVYTTATPDAPAPPSSPHRGLSWRRRPTARNRVTNEIVKSNDQPADRRESTT